MACVSSAEAASITLLSSTDDPLIETFRNLPTTDALLKLSRYESTIRRNWFRAHAELRALVGRQPDSISAWKQREGM